MQDRACPHSWDSEEKLWLKHTGWPRRPWARAGPQSQGEQETPLQRAEGQAARLSGQQVAQTLSAECPHQDDCVRRSPGSSGAVSLQGNRMLWACSWGMSAADKGASEARRNKRQEHLLPPAVTLLRSLLTKLNITAATKENY